jgi:transcriptional regulator with XRE-family HTH domain
MNLGEYKKASGMTYRAMAQEIGVTERTVARWVHKRKDVDSLHPLVAAALVEKLAKHQKKKGAT